MNIYTPSKRDLRMRRSNIVKLSAVLCLLVLATSVFVFVRTAVFAASTIQILAFDSNVATTTNTIYPHVRIVNTGASTISLASIKVRYYYTEDGTQSQSFWCDWSPSGSANVTGTFTSLSTPVAGADHYLEIGFTSGAGNLAPGAATEVQARFAKSDWSNYTQTNDYSFNPSASNYVAWKNVTAYLSGVLSWGTEPGGSSATATPTTAPTQTATAVPTQSATATPTAVPTQVPTATPTVVPTPPATVTPTSTPTSSDPDSDRYFPAGTSVATMISTASAMSQQQVKLLIEQEVSDHWSLIQSKLGFTTKEKAYAFFLGQATRESTLNAGLETGGGSAHSYGPLQAAETAYANANPSYVPETDVPEMYQYNFTPQNFYDVGIAIHMGIRHLIHFANLARAAGYTGVNVVRYALIGYNTGWVTNVDPNLLTSYSDEIGSLAGWYLNNGHLYDTAWTWTGDSRVNRSSPWGWY
jgi:Cellulose binding domain